MAESQNPPIEDPSDPQPPDTTARNVRYSDSPQRWTRITEGPSLPSPARSIHPEQHSVNRMDSIDSQVDYGLRNTDFFEDESSLSSSSSSDRGGGRPVKAAIETEERSISPAKKRVKTPAPLIKPLVSQCEPKGGTTEDWPLQPGSEGRYQRLDSNLAALVAPVRTSTPSTTYTGSIDEFVNDLAPDDVDANNNTTPRRPNPIRTSSARTPRSSGTWKNNNNDHHHHPPDPQRRSQTYDREGRRSQTYDPRISTYSEEFEHRLGIHAIAHEVYLNGLFRDEELLHQHKLHAAVSPIVQPARIRESMLPSSLRPGPRRSPPTVPPRPPRSSTSDSALGTKGPTGGKKVHLIPPPIDLTGPHPSLPENLVRTPYPFSATRHQKAFSAPSTPPLLGPANAESLLTVSVRRTKTSTATPRIATMTIPAASSYSVLPHMESSVLLSYDDASFFLALRRAYTSLVPCSFRLLSARSLRGIEVSTRTKFDHERGWLPGSRSPRRVAGKGLTDSFSPESILAGFKKPKRGKGRMAFVGWAQRLAAVDQPVPAVGEDERDGVELARRRDDGEGLEFVVGWSWRRILMAVGVMVGLAVAAVLLWVFLGTGRGGPEGRVGTGCALAVVVFLVGMGVVGVWLGVNWVVM